MPTNSTGDDDVPALMLIIITTNNNVLNVANRIQNSKTFSHFNKICHSLLISCILKTLLRMEDRIKVIREGITRKKT